MASFSCSVVPQRYDYAALDASFTGGDSGYTRRRFVRFTISGGGYTSTWDILSKEVGGADSTFEDDVEPLTGSTTYTWSATLGYFDGSDVKQLSGYTDSGSFTTPAEPVPTGAFIWNGSVWVSAPPYVWTGSAWKPAAAKLWTSSAWQP